MYICRLKKEMTMAGASHFLPITKKELDYLGWDYVDVIIVNGDA